MRLSPTEAEGMAAVRRQERQDARVRADAEVMTRRATVPVGSDGLEGWTSCCEAAVTYSETALCCKACWHEVDVIALDGEQADELSEIVRAVIRSEISAHEGVGRQRALLAGVRS